MQADRSGGDHADADPDDPVVIDIRDPYEQLVAIARLYGRDEIKHLTRAYQAIAPNGGGRIIDLTALLD